MKLHHASISYQFGKNIVFVPVVIILGILPACEDADCKVKVTLVQVRMGLGAIMLEVCRDDVESNVFCGACNGLRGSNKKQRYLFCLISSSYLPETSGGSSRS